MFPRTLRLALTFSALATLLSACAEPECPVGTIKIRNICRHIDAGTSLDDAAVVAADGAQQDDESDAGGSDDGMERDASTAGTDAGAVVTTDASGTAGLDAGGVSQTDSGIADASTIGAVDATADAVVSCGAGYGLKNGACQDIDECFEGTHGCHVTSTCKNTAGSYDCTCPLGYAGGTNAGFACAPRIAVGYDHSCVLLGDGTVQCWGKNAVGQIGDGTQSDRYVPTLVSGLNGVVAIRAGNQSTCALLGDATLRCWGANGTGGLGDGTTMNRALPTAVQRVEEVVAFDTSGAHACAVQRSGALKCWGSNGDGQLGTGASSSTPTLTPVGAAGITMTINVFLGPSQTCVVHKNGSADCWGRGFLGNGTTSSLTPVAVSVPNNVRSMALGPFHACSLQASGSVYCWGPPALGGSGSAAGDQSPDVVAGIGAKAVGIGIYSTCILQSDGTLAWWDYELMPASVGGVNRVVAMASLGTNVCEIVEDGTISCWTIANAKLTAPVTVSGLDLW